jgi:glycosyltransferase involved in cell wall biosynthesis
VGEAPSGRRARILFLTNTLGTGGAERQIALTVANLDPARFEPIVCCLFLGGAYLEEIRSSGVEALALGLPKRLGSAVVGARRTVRDLQPDLVHTSMFEANVAGRLAVRRAKVPVVSHATNVYDDPTRFEETPVTGWKLRGARRVERWSARVSHAQIVAVGEAVADSAARYLGLSRERLTVIRRGWDFRALDEASGRPLEAPAWPERASPRLLTVGRLQPQKGQQHLLHALPRLHRRYPRAHLAVAGAGPLLDELTLLAEGLGVRRSVSFLGTRRDVPALLAAADVFAFPSLWEGAAGALVEAIALGVPVVASDVPSLREIADLSGPDGAGAVRLVDPKDPDATAGAIAALALDPAAAREAARRAAPGIRAAHDIHGNTRALEAFYGRVLRGPAGARLPLDA